jgi:hypothetical protein
MSASGNGAVILTVPEPPIAISNVPEITNFNTIGLSWLEGLNNGGTSVIDYRVSYNMGSGTKFYTLESNIVTLPY